MTKMIGGLGLALAVFGFALAAPPAGAQENLDSGKTGAQMFATDCAICHKSAQGLNRSAGGLFGLADFLREHYTASRESASKIAAYLQALPRAASVKREGVKERSTKTGEKGGEKSDEKRKVEDKKSKTGEAKSGEAKSNESKSGKPAEAKTKTSTSKTEAKTGTKPSEPKSGTAKRKADEAKANASKPDKPAKPD
jgi:hypothetical protein